MKKNMLMLEDICIGWLRDICCCGKKIIVIGAALLMLIPRARHSIVLQ